MKIWLNDKIVEVDEPETLDELTQEQQPDKVTKLIEGLSSATTISQIRNIAKDILESTNESE